MDPKIGPQEVTTGVIKIKGAKGSDKKITFWEGTGEEAAATTRTAKVSSCILPPATCNTSLDPATCNLHPTTLDIYFESAAYSANTL